MVGNDFSSFRALDRNNPVWTNFRYLSEVITEVQADILENVLPL